MADYQEIFENLFKENRADATFSEQELQNSWEKLLSILHNENDNGYLNHFFTRQNGVNLDFVQSSFIDFIQSKSDMPDGGIRPTEPTDAFEELLEVLRMMQQSADNIEGDLPHLSVPADILQGNFWNESVNAALKHYLKHIELVNPKQSIPGIEYITYDDIINANAGANFDYEKEFVIPWKNIDNTDYKTVRNGDEIKSVIENNGKLQFTHSNSSDWIRLLMPKYGRHVEIEDLDRNFWVIGQTISGISAYLFDENSPIKEAFKNVLREITELWENILFLWAALAMLEKKVYKDVHVEVVYLPNNEHQPYLKYDNFTYDEDGHLTWKDICDRLEPYKHMYPDYNLILIPIKRIKNYNHNYYQTEQYPGIAFYDRNNIFEKNHGFRILSFQKETSQDEYTETGSISLKEKVTDDTNLGDYSYAFSNNGDGSIKTIYPFNSVKDETEFEVSNYYGALRTIINFSSDDYSYTPQNGFAIKRFSFNVEDAVWKAVKENSATSFKGLNSYKKGFDLGQEWLEINSAIEEGSDRYRIPLSITVPSIISNPEEESFTSFEKGMYLGELASNIEQTSEISYEIKNKEIKTPPLITSRGNAAFLINDYQGSIKEKLKDLNASILQQIDKKQLTSKENEIVLYTGTRAFNLYKPELSDIKDKIIELASGTVDLGGYYDVNGHGNLRPRHDLYDEDIDDKYKDQPLSIIPQGTPPLVDATQLLTNLNKIMGDDDRLQDEDVWDFGTNDNTSVHDEWDLAKNPYKLPLSYYTYIDVDDNNISRKHIPSNLYSDKELVTNENINNDTIKSKVNNLYEHMKYSGTHGGRLEIGAILSVPGKDIEVYKNFDSYRVFPEINHYYNWLIRSLDNTGPEGGSQPGDYAGKYPPRWINWTNEQKEEGGEIYGTVFGFWLQGEPKSSTRHSWNCDTTIILKKKGEKLTRDNWCIVYIQTYGIYGVFSRIDTSITTDLYITKNSENDNGQYTSQISENSITIYGDESPYDRMPLKYYPIPNKTYLQKYVWDIRDYNKEDYDGDPNKKACYAYKPINAEIKPYTFKTVTHVFKPNGGYSQFEKSRIDITLSQDKSEETYTLRRTNKKGEDSIDEDIDNVLQELLPQNKTTNWFDGIGDTQYSLISWNSTSSGYKRDSNNNISKNRTKHSALFVDDNDKCKEEEYLYNFYRYPNAGRGNN